MALLLALLDEVLIEIFKYLNISQLYRVMHSCHRLSLVLRDGYSILFKDNVAGSAGAAGSAGEAEVVGSAEAVKVVGSADATEVSIYLACVAEIVGSADLNSNFLVRLLSQNG
ncbi:hypothetical protein DAPPUDRAFT_107243 [Daphnia pulex]|uniref:F-box domain-containing protein n=1 Tax=Daphnia pulex TaxID=6669 RepID=E9GWG7_DAPPU|nr:hypothetical protein DAPPUDRAFT_107243 [Daphnia pulex]|eukprot:EFX76100.1 hypothetical protein DAPPUDRAFT_107243 [Daphnia pulex]